MKVGSSVVIIKTMRETLELYSEQKGSNILMFELNNNTLYGETNFEELQQHRV